MTETREIDVIAEALTVIDRALAEIINRELVSSGEVADVLLDVRTLLTTQQPSELLKVAGPLCRCGALGLRTACRRRAVPRTPLR